jgi:hypothetical protein
MRAGASPFMNFTRNVSFAIAVLGVSAKLNLHLLPV